MTRKWQLQEAKARLSEVIDESLVHGPQIVTRRGVDTAVLVSFDEWQELKQRARPMLIEFLLGDGPRFDLDVPPRGQRHRRAPPDLG